MKTIYLGVFMKFILVQYLTRVGITLTVALNVIIFGGYSNQTFSARNYEWKRQGKPNIVFLIDGVWFVFSGKKVKHHCLDSWSYWYIRKYRMNCKEQDYIKEWF